MKEENDKPPSIAAAIPPGGHREHEMKIASQCSTMQATKNDIPASLHVIPLAEFLRRPRRRKTFGNWRLDRRNFCLVLHGGPYDYDIPLRRCQTSAQVLDWIFQVAAKTWATAAIIGGLVQAFHYYLDPQATLCSFGEDLGPIDALTVVRGNWR